MITKIVAPTNNVNDASVAVYEFLVEDGTEVKKGQDVLIVETSKATVNIESPADGFIKFVVKIGDEVPNGELLAIVADKKEELSSFETIQPMKTVKPDTFSKAETAETAKTLKTETFGVFDDAVTLGEIMFKNGVAVKEGDVVCKVRHADRVETVKSPMAGYVFWNKKPYEAVKAGEALGAISSVPVAPEILPEDVKYSSIRISKAAQELLNERGLTAESLGLSGLITVNSILDKIEPKKTHADTSPILPMSQEESHHSAAGHYEKLSKAKRAEANFLSTANRYAVVSQVTVLVPTQGIFSACGKNQDLAKRFSAIILLETSRLLKSYPAMNAVYDAEQLYVYDTVNVGYAIAIDDGLKVPVFKNADKKDLETIIAEKEKFIEKYVSKELKPEDLDGGTFTITDLSSTGCYTFNPVLNLGQSAILGVGGENTTNTEYPLILAFDHRVIDGATATEFLCKLRDRLIAHENVLLGKKKITPAEMAAHYPAPSSNEVDVANLACDSCYRTAEELDEMGHYLFKVIDKNGQEKHICSICMRGW